MDKKFVRQFSNKILGNHLNTNKEKFDNLAKKMKLICDIHKSENNICNVNGCNNKMLKFKTCYHHLKSVDIQEEIYNKIVPIADTFSNLLEEDKIIIYKVLLLNQCSHRRFITKSKKQLDIISHKLATHNLLLYHYLARYGSYENIFYDRKDFILTHEKDIINEIDKEHDTKDLLIQLLFNFIDDIDNTYHENIKKKCVENNEDMDMPREVSKSFKTYTKLHDEIQQRNNFIDSVETIKNNMIRNDEINIKCKNVKSDENMILHNLQKISRKIPLCFCREKTFEDLKNKSRLRFDFYGFLYIESGYICQFVIEVDDKSHWCKNNNFNDMHKNFYCWLNGINILRIDTTKCMRNKLSYKKIIKKFLKTIVSTKRLTFFCTHKLRYDCSIFKVCT